MTVKSEAEPCTCQVEQSTRSTNRSFKRLIKLNGTKPEEIYKAICSQTVELIFTAHPTQVWSEELHATMLQDLHTSTLSHFILTKRMAVLPTVNCPGPLSSMLPMLQGVWPISTVHATAFAPGAYSTGE